MFVESNNTLVSNIPFAVAMFVTFVPMKRHATLTSGRSSTIFFLRTGFKEDLHFRLEPICWWLTTIFSAKSHIQAAG
jgi:hypothetical protein